MPASEHIMLRHGCTLALTLTPGAFAHARTTSPEGTPVTSPGHPVAGFDDIIYTVPEIAKRFRVTSMTIYRLIEDEELACAHIGKSIRVSDKALCKYLGCQPNPDDTYLTVAEVAEVFRLSKLTVLRRVRSGELEALRVGIQVRIPERAVRAIIAGER
jgi:excisionase family DNA binding protein